MSQTSERANRAEDVRQERRRKPGSVIATGRKLGVNEEALDRKTYEYRFVNDTPGRVQAMHDNDWDPVSDPNAKPDADGAGTVVAKHVGTNEAGQSVRAHLMRKRKDWYDADQKEKQAPLNAVDEAIRRGVAHKATEGGAELGEGAYTPGSGNSISRYTP